MPLSSPPALLLLALAPCASAAAQAVYPAHEVALLAQLDPIALGHSSASDCWGYTSPSGREYAIVCLDGGTAWVEVTSPTQPAIVAGHPGPASTLRDVKVFEDHAYVGAEYGQGIQVFDMSSIDAGTVAYVGDVTVGGAANTHNVAIDEDSGYLYRLGTGSGMLIYDLNASKASPPFVAAWNGVYVHDAQALTYTKGPAAGREIVLACVGQSGFWTLDVTDKQNVVVLDTLTWPLMFYAHQGWLDADERYFYLNDELDESAYQLDTTTIVIDAADPANVSVASVFDNGNTATGHNGYPTASGRLYEANYTSGLRVFDLAVDPLDPPEVGWFDTWPSDDIPSFDGAFSVYPYFPSGVVVGTDKLGGLFVWWAEEPLVAVSLAIPAPPLVGASGQILPVTITESEPGMLVAGSETFHYDDGSGWQSAPLVDLGGGSYQAWFPDLACGSQVAYYFSADSASGLTWYDPVPGAGAPYGALVATTETVVFADDFETEKGWTPSNLGAFAGDFERGVPVNDPNWEHDPEADADGSGQCWLTENALGNTDVDGGAVRLLSPPLDLTGSHPVVEYAYYLNLTDESGVDAMVVEANYGAGSGWREVARHTTSGHVKWRTHQVLATDFTSAGVSLSPSVRLRFDVNDGDPQSIVESGLDAFSVRYLDCATFATYCTAGTTASGCRVQLAASGTPSLSLASGFTVSGGQAEGQKNGLFYFGQNGRQANPWGLGTSYQCVVPPVRRTPLLSGGGTSSACDGAFAIDFNAWATAHPQKAPAAGVATQTQLWFRDPQNTSGQSTSLSDALEFTMTP